MLSIAIHSNVYSVQTIHFAPICQNVPTHYRTQTHESSGHGSQIVFLDLRDEQTDVRMLRMAARSSR